MDYSFSCFRLHKKPFKRKLISLPVEIHCCIVLLRPEVMKPDEKYPLVLFLHGAGERGNDNEKQLVHGGQMWLNPVNREKYPAFIFGSAVS